MVRKQEKAEAKYAVLYAKDDGDEKD